MSHRLVNLAVGVSILAIAGCRAAADVPPASTARAVRTAPLRDSVVARPVTGAGTLAPRDALPLGFKIGGVIERVTVDAGDRVRAGQLLAVLQPREIDAGVAKARAALEKAERDRDRAERLQADSVMTLVQYQDARTAVDVARADLDAASFNQRYARIEAPSAGTILRRNASAGELVQPGTSVLVLGSAVRGTVFRVDVVDRDVVRLRLGARATVRLDAVPTRRFQGTVAEIAAAPTPGTGTYAVQVAVADAAELPSGLVGRAEIAAERADAVTVVPVEAVVEANGDRAAVFTLQQGKAHRREVQVTFIEGRMVGVRGNLAGAEAVITDGAAYLDDGDAVRVTP